MKLFSKHLGIPRSPSKPRKNRALSAEQELPRKRITLSDISAKNPQQPLIDELTQVLAHRTGQIEEQHILERLRPLSHENLDIVLRGLNLKRLLQALDHRFWGKDSRLQFFEILCSRMKQLSIELKAQLVAILARGHTDFREEKVIRTALLSETGAQLTKLKLEIDTDRRGHDLLAIVTRDIDDPGLRFEIIEHFRNSVDKDVHNGDRLLRVVSDIDDTIYSSLNDQRHPKGTVYPGVLKLHSLLSELPPIFLTSRPELVGSLFERWTHRKLNRYGIVKPTILSGTLPGLLGHRRMAEQKALNLIGYQELFPEFRFVFIGDSGQGDLILSEQLLKRKVPPIEVALIHRLSEFSPGAQSENPRIHHFSDYGQAAQILTELGYLSSEHATMVKEEVSSHTGI